MSPELYFAKLSDRILTRVQDCFFLLVGLGSIEKVQDGRHILNIQSGGITTALKAETYGQSG